MYHHKQKFDWLQAAINVVCGFLLLIPVCYETGMTLETQLITLVAMFVVMVGLWVAMRDD